MVESVDSFSFLKETSSRVILYLYLIKYVAKVQENRTDILTR
jgi:hypothetical protein